MRYFYILVAAGTLLSSFCASAPTGSSESITFINSTALPDVACLPDSHLKAAAAGIDIYGEIPGDYIQKNGSIYHFAEGSNASTWARAQLDIKHDSNPPDVQKRWVFSGVGIGMWSESDVKGYGVWFDNVAYGASYFSSSADMQFKSVGISYRGLYDGIEQLDFSISDGTSLCGKFVYTCGKIEGPEYWNTEPVSCFRLWLRGP
ncbi:hypothetical protein MMC30_003332 [Trapelia coarctata]|nr:hypothetical protein [Trapelia coarctata]